MLGGGLARDLGRRAIAIGFAAGAAMVAIAALGATIFYALCLVIVPLAAAAITCLLFAVIALSIVLIYFGGQREPPPPDETDSSLGLAEHAVSLFRERPILGTAVALAGGLIFLRNPALVTLVTAALTDKVTGTPPRRR